MNKLGHMKPCFYMSSDKHWTLMGDTLASYVGELVFKLWLRDRVFWQIFLGLRQSLQSNAKILLGLDSFSHHLHH